MEKHLFYSQNLEVCLKRKNNLAVFERIQKPDSDEMCEVIFGSFLFSKYHIDSDFHLFQSILLETSFLELDFCCLLQVYNQILN